MCYYSKTTCMNDPHILAMNNGCRVLRTHILQPAWWPTQTDSCKSVDGAFVRLWKENPSRTSDMAGKPLQGEIIAGAQPQIPMQKVSL